METVGHERRLAAYVRELSAKVEYHARVLGLNKEPLNLSASRLSWLQQASIANSQQGWSPHVEPAFADLFEHLRLEDLELLAGSTGEHHPWISFYRFCLTMLHAPFDRSLRDQLDAGKENLRRIASVWCYLHGVPSRTERKLVARAKPDGRVLRKFRGHGESDPDEEAGQ